MDYVPLRRRRAYRRRSIGENQRRQGAKARRAHGSRGAARAHAYGARGGIVQASQRLYTVAPKFEGWIQKLHVNTTGQAVRKGEPLMDIYSPDLITAQQEYLIAWKGMQSVKDSSPEVQASMHQLMESALQRLRNWDISKADLKQLQRDGKARQYLTLRSQANGVVLEKPAVEGRRFMPGEMLYQIADLSSVWLLAEVFEQELGLVRQGLAVNVHVDAYPTRRSLAQ
ncbi:efflux RND transporter periplasmic adaptor subunit [Cupriavidus basilensis]